MNLVPRFIEPSSNASAHDSLETSVEKSVFSEVLNGKGVFEVIEHHTCKLRWLRHSEWPIGWRAQLQQADALFASSSCLWPCCSGWLKDLH